MGADDNVHVCRHLVLFIPRWKKSEQIPLQKCQRKSRGQRTDRQPHKEEYVVVVEVLSRVTRHRILPSGLRAVHTDLHGDILRAGGQNSWGEGRQGSQVP